jgi:hypothetical protein
MAQDVGPEFKPQYHKKKKFLKKQKDWGHDSNDSVVEY